MNDSEEVDFILTNRIANREVHELDVVDERPYNLRRNRRAPESFGIPIMGYYLYNCIIVAEIETFTTAETLNLRYREERKKKRAKKYSFVTFTSIVLLTFASLIFFVAIFCLSGFVLGGGSVEELGCELQRRGRCVKKRKNGERLGLRN